ncbi:MAG: M67 family metallopeptidase [Proteobacteria bacterium]|nr:M67 family metallopeptidase [Pseudomonadota bacterium]
MVLVVTSGVIATLRQQSAAMAPHEACGLLLGHGQTITGARPTANLAPDPARQFEIDPAALVAAHRAARNGGPAVLGYYHSHPTGDPTPSPTDRARAGHDGRIWAIIGAEAIGWWRDERHGFTAETVQIIP